MPQARWVSRQCSDRLPVNDWVKKLVYFLGKVSGWSYWTQQGFRESRHCLVDVVGGPSNLEHSLQSFHGLYHKHCSQHLSHNLFHQSTWHHCKSVSFNFIIYPFVLLGSLNLAFTLPSSVELLIPTSNKAQQSGEAITNKRFSYSKELQLIALNRHKLQK